MKKIIIYFLIVYNFILSLHADEKYCMYRDIAMRTSTYGWGNYRCRIENGTPCSVNITAGDHLWFTGFYGVFLALDHTLPWNIKKMQIRNFLNGIMKMLIENDHMFLQDNSPDFINKWKENNSEYKYYEASKDQILGMTTALFMIYYYVDDSEIRSLIKSILGHELKNLNYDHITEYLFSRIKGRRYKTSDADLGLHSYGLNAAFKYITGENLCHLTSAATMRTIIFDMHLREPQKWLQIYKGTLFGLNLDFFELLINVTISRHEANDFINAMNNVQIKSMKHLNLAALYVYACNIYGINGSELWYYKKVLTHDNHWYPDQITINIDNNKIGWDCRIPGNALPCTDWGTFRYDINFQDIDFPYDWDMPPPKNVNKNINDLWNKSYSGIVDIDCGIPYLARRVLSASASDGDISVVGPGPFDLPGGVDFSSASISHISSDPATGDIQFIYQCSQAQPGDPVINLEAEQKRLENAFMCALALPNPKQYISLPAAYNSATHQMEGNAEYLAPFQETELCRIMFAADARMKFSDDALDRQMEQVNMRRWEESVMQSPWYESYLRPQGFWETPCTTVRKCIIPDYVNASAEGSKILVTDSKLTIECELEEAVLNLSGYNLPSHVIADLNNRLATWKTTYQKQLTAAVIPAVSSTINNAQIDEYIKMRELYPAVAAAHWYKTLPRENLKYKYLIDSENLDNIRSDIPFNHDYWAQQAYQYISEYPFSIFGYSGISTVYGGAVMRTASPVITGEITAGQEELINLVKQNGYVQEGNNFYISGRKFKLPSIELAVKEDITFSNPNFISGKENSVAFSLVNKGSENAGSFKISIHHISVQGGIEYPQGSSEIEISSLPAASSVPAGFSYQVCAVTGQHILRIIIDSQNHIREMDEENNIFDFTCYVQSPYPFAHIASPSADSGFFSGQTIQFQAEGGDLEEPGLPESAFRWSSGISGILGSGRNLDLASLEPGNHIITLEVTDSENLASTDKISLVIHPPNYPLVVLLSPLNGKIFNRGEMIYFSGTGLDPEEGLLTGNSLV
ncbi:MAG TPA: hypothetical protein DC049_03390 [Spirochaetia bacterium]|nr:hypothetical protein [Spirochaetia bacterium]